MNQISILCIKSVTPSPNWPRAAQHFCLFLFIPVAHFVSIAINDERLTGEVEMRSYLYDDTASFHYKNLNKVTTWFPTYCWLYFKSFPV